MTASDGLLRGIVHAHSTRSFDGTCDYAALRELFMAGGLDFVCMTEHIEHLDQGDIDAILADCAAHSDERFLFVPGIEMDCFVVYFLGVSPTRVDFSDDRTIFDSLRPNARLCVLSHPIKAKYDYPDWIVETCDAVEIMNNKHDGKFFFRPQSERMLDRIRRRKPSVAAVVGMDFHHVDQFCPIHIRLNRPGPLTAEFVTAEIGAGNTAFHDGETCLSGLSPLARLVRRGRVHVMDGAHRINYAMQQAGFKVPGPLRRHIARVMEGG